MVVRQPLVIQAEDMEDGGVEVVYRDHVFDRAVSELVGCPIGEWGFDAGTSHPAREPVIVVVAAGGSGAVVSAVVAVVVSVVICAVSCVCVALVVDTGSSSAPHAVNVTRSAQMYATANGWDFRIDLSCR